MTRIGLIGCGAVARRFHLPALKDQRDVAIPAFASRSLGSAELARDEWGDGDVFDDWRKVLELDDVDAVDICSPNASHCDQAVAAARAGKHVLVEKPIARTVAEADEMIAAAHDARVVLHVAHNVRYLPVVVAAREAAGKVGQIVGVRAAFGHSGPKDWAPDSTWFFNAELAGGGALIDLGIHIIDVVRFVTHLEADTVTAMTIGDGEVEDAAQILLRFTNGAIGSVHASWIARPAPDMGLTVFGTDGTLHFDVRTPLIFRAATGEKEEIALPTVTSSPYLDFARVVAGEAPGGPVATGRDGRAALAVVCAAYESARTQKTVEVDR